MINFYINIQMKYIYIFSFTQSSAACAPTSTIFHTIYIKPKYFLLNRQI